MEIASRANERRKREQKRDGGCCHHRRRFCIYEHRRANSNANPFQPRLQILDQLESSILTRRFRENSRIQCQLSYRLSTINLLKRRRRINEERIVGRRDGETRQITLAFVERNMLQRKRKAKKRGQGLSQRQYFYSIGVLLEARDFHSPFYSCYFISLAPIHVSLFNLR